MTMSAPLLGASLTLQILPDGLTAGTTICQDSNGRLRWHGCQAIGRSPLFGEIKSSSVNKAGAGIEEKNVVKSSKSTLCCCFSFLWETLASSWQINLTCSSSSLFFRPGTLQEIEKCHQRSEESVYSLTLSLVSSLFDALCKILGAVSLSMKIRRKSEGNGMSYALCHTKTRLLPPPSQEFAAVATCPVSPRDGIESALSTRFPCKMCPLTIVPFALIFIQ